MPSIDKYLKITTGNFSWSQHEEVGDLIWEHQYLNDILTMQFTVGWDKNHYILINRQQIDVMPVQRGHEFICPGCGQHVRALYIPVTGGQFACRHCHHIHYVRGPKIEVQAGKVEETLNEILVR